MGFRLRIEADYGNEVLQNDHPREHSSGGKAVLAFLSGLQSYCSLEGEEEFPELQLIKEWYQHLDDAANSSLCAKCRALLDCMWGDGGDSTVYQADEWEFYKKRHANMIDDGFTEDMFKKMVQDYDLHWKPIL